MIYQIEQKRLLYEDHIYVHICVSTYIYNICKLRLSFCMNYIYPFLWQKSLREKYQNNEKRNQISI